MLAQLSLYFPDNNIFEFASDSHSKLRSNRLTMNKKIKISVLIRLETVVNYIKFQEIRSRIHRFGARSIRHCKRKNPTDQTLRTTNNLLQFLNGGQCCLLKYNQSTTLIQNLEWFDQAKIVYSVSNHNKQAQYHQKTLYYIGPNDS